MMPTLIDLQGNKIMKQLIDPTTNFSAVRDGRNSQVFYFDVALDTARSVAANTQQVFNISGNSFYIDANPNDGNGVVHFQDTNFDRGPVPLYVSPGTIFTIPFTQILLENTAQAGKKIRICYGIDVDFQPGSVSQIAVTNAGGFTSVRPEAPTSNWNNNSLLVLNTPVTVFTPGSNTNGVILLSAYGKDALAADAAQVFIAKSSAPVSTTDGDVICANVMGASNYSSNSLPMAARIAAGQGLYYISSLGGSATGYRSARWLNL